MATHDAAVLLVGFIIGRCNGGFARRGGFPCSGLFYCCRPSWAAGMSDMDKRTETVSFRLPESLYRQLQAIALARDVTLSDLVCTAMAEEVERARVAYLRLRPAFEDRQDLPGTPGEVR